jgi:hypothetical protein
MLEAVDELRARIDNGEITSLAIVAEVMRRGPPRIVIQGRFISDPYRALAALTMAEVRMLVLSGALRSDFSDH